MIIGVPKEIIPGERRVALVPDVVPRLTKAGLQVLIAPDAGAEAGFLDSAYEEKGARISPRVLAEADLVLKVQPPTPEEIGEMKEEALLIGLLQPHTNATGNAALAARRITAFALELIPRISRAQSMDVLSSMSTIAGYKAVLIAANRLAKMFPLLMTAAGTVAPARLAVLGAGVAGLQAIATAKRLGAVVEAYDPRPAAKEQIESLGARCMEIGLEAKEAEATTGYAKAQSDDFYRRQRQLMGDWLAAVDAVITTALVQGQRAPVLLTEEMLQRMRHGSVIVDLAAEQGGNCALTKPNAEVIHHGVVILGPVNLPSTVPYHASQMYARNVSQFIEHLFHEGKLRFDLSDELTSGPLITYQGEIRLRNEGLEQ
jgi:NAD(P) transhydrogenase subunit alpha